MWDAELLYRELPATRGAGIPEVWVSAKGRATGFSSHPLSYDKGEFPAGAVNRAVMKNGRPALRAVCSVCGTGKYRIGSSG